MLTGVAIASANSAFEVIIVTLFIPFIGYPVLGLLYENIIDYRSLRISHNSQMLQ